MTDIDIIPVQRLDFLVSPMAWSFAADRRTEIEDYFTHLRRGKPQLWNGRVLLLRNVRREIAEETGLSLDGVTTDPWFVVLAPSRVALIKVFRFRKSAADMRASILDHLKSEALPELSDVHTVRDPSDFKPSMPPFVRAFLLHFWDCDSGR